MDTLRPFERRLVMEAAVMGLVRGHLAGQCGAEVPRSDAAILHEVIDACIGFADRYPHLATASTGRRRRITKGATVAR
ncbi:hypothetical protein EV384_4616 [Micromonospora kangleipakensis]|uniref:Uncharacterized protein n=1 Tax=Micromonospora kangleipakensis TaxID=1077942 RepID=A0A4Q8BDP9_9ACTN|nr:hypothetical protein [Micromonospora kangleipakensis]RZU76020.1 hypothetical protein EV384_4616 [Micromonospora kangleipakensis]